MFVVHGIALILQGGRSLKISIMVEETTPRKIEKVSRLSLVSADGEYFSKVKIRHSRGKKNNELAKIWENEEQLRQKSFFKCQALSTSVE